MSRGFAASIGYNVSSPEATVVPAAGSAEADAAAYAKLFEANGYRVERFLGPAASRWAVLAYLHDLAGEAAAGDVVAVSFSGAGGRRWSGRGVETFWQCSDGRLTHSDLQRAWSWFGAGVRLLIIDDCCYSTFSDWTGAWSAFDVVGYGVTRHNVGDALVSTPGAAASSAVDISASVLCLTACSCPDSQRNGCPGGLFTEALLRTWNRGRFRGSYDTFCRRIRQALCGLQTPELVAAGPHARDFEMQRPFTIVPPPETETLSWLAKATAGSNSSRSSCTTAMKRARKRSSSSA